VDSSGDAGAVVAEILRSGVAGIPSGELAPPLAFDEPNP